MRLVRAGTFVILFAILNSRSSLRAQAAGLASAKVDFLTQIQPIFESSCYGCHGPKVQMAGLRLNEKSAALAGGQSGAVIIPGKSADSPLYRRVAGLGDQPRMPMGGKPLDASQIELIRLWIDRGAEWPDSATKEVVQVQKHWAYIPPKRPPLPKVVNARWPRNAIDNFLLARLEREKLIPSPEADRVTLLRRLSLDLTGLPPSVEEVDAFLKDQSHNAYEKQVDRLLNSPHYGERWGRLLAGRRALRRFRRLRKRQAALGLVLSRLGDQRAQPRSAVRPIRHRPDCRR